METTISLPRETRAAELRAPSFDAADNTIDVCWTTGAQVQRVSWMDGPYLEELQVDAASVRLDRLNAGAAFLNSHDSCDLEAVLGAVVPGSARIENGQGLAKVKLSSAAGDADIVQKIRDGIIRNISVGYVRHRIQKNESDDGTMPVWLVTDWEPFEISAVAVPADAGAQVRSDPAKPDEKLYACVAVRADPSSITPAAPAAKPGDNTMTSGANSAAETSGLTADQARALEAENARAATERAATDKTAREAASKAAAEAARGAERTRAAAITEMANVHGQRALGDAHIASGTEVEAFRGLLLDKLAEQSRSNGPGISSVVMGVTDAEKRGAAIQDALLHRFDPSTPLSDEGREFRGMTILEMGRDYLESAGVRTRGMSKTELAEQMLIRRTGFEVQHRSGGMLSTSDFPNVLANVANKTLRQGYEAAAQTFRPLVRVVTVPDFKQVSRTQLGEAPQLEKVTEHGEFKRGKIGDAAEKYSIATYGKIVAITRQVLINDDLGAFTRIPRAFGIAAANLESDLVWGIITVNAAMSDTVALFHATHKNLGTAGVISVATVGAGRQAMRNQTGLDGKTLLNIAPTYIIVPTALETSLEQFLGPIFPATTAAQVPDSMKKLQAISEPRLDAASASNWYMAGDPNQIDTIELAYLEGQEGLYTETRTGFDVDGIEVKVRQDVGAKAIDWRGLYKNPN